jgi:hypothetical protein
MPTATKPKTFLQKIAAAAGEMDNPKKRSDNPFYKSKFANLSDTMDIVEPVLDTWGLAHRVYFDGTAIVYCVYDPDTSEAILSSLDIGPIMSNLEGNVWQQMGQAFTYLRRYLAQAFWGMIPEDDDAKSAPSRPAAQRVSTPSTRRGGTPAKSPDIFPEYENSNGGAL